MVALGQLIDGNFLEVRQQLRPVTTEADALHKETPVVEGTQDRAE